MLCRLLIDTPPTENAATRTDVLPEVFRLRQISSLDRLRQFGSGRFAHSRFSVNLTRTNTLDAVKMRRKAFRLVDTASDAHGQRRRRSPKRLRLCSPYYTSNIVVTVSRLLGPTAHSILVTASQSFLGSLLRFGLFQRWRFWHQFFLQYLGNRFEQLRDVGRNCQRLFNVAERVLGHEVVF